MNVGNVNLCIAEEQQLQIEERTRPMNIVKMRDSDATYKPSTDEEYVLNYFADWEAVHGFYEEQIPDLRDASGYGGETGWVTVRCPILDHHDSRPSFGLNLENGAWHCHGCDKSGRNPIHFLMYVEGIPFKDALAKLVEYTNTHESVTDEELKRRAEKREAREREAAEKVAAPDVELLSIDAVKEYHGNLFLKENYAEYSYLKYRGIEDDVLRKYLVGVIPQYYKSEKSNTAMPKAITFPIINAEDTVVGVKLRSLFYSVSSAPMEVGKYSLTGSKAGLYGLQYLKDVPMGTPVLIVEGEIDFLKVSQRGYTALGLSMGAGSWQKKWVEFVKDRHVVIILDDDEAGQKGCEKIKLSLYKHVKSLKVVEHLFTSEDDPAWKDIGDYFDKAGCTTEDFDALIEATQPYTPADMTKPLRDVLKSYQALRESEEAQGDVVCDWLVHNGVQFYHTKTGVTYLSYDDTVYEISPHDRYFTALLDSLTGVTTATRRGQVMVKKLQNRALLTGDALEVDDGWLITDKSTNSLFMSLNNAADELVHISPKSVQVVKNINNDHKAFVTVGDWAKPVEFKRLSAVEYLEGRRLIKRLVVDNISASPSNRLLLWSWMVSSPFIDFTYVRPLIRLAGVSGDGKSTVTDILGHALYGGECKVVPTNASLYAMGQRNPVLFLDNIERNDLTPEFRKWLLVSATGVERTMRSIGTDSGVISMRQRCCVLHNGIESLYLNEIINRHLTVEISKVNFPVQNFSHSCLDDIADNYNLIQNTMFKMYSVVLHWLEQGYFKIYLDKIETQHPNHAKVRTNRYLAIMLLMTQALLTGIEKSDVKSLRADWIEGQTVDTDEVQINTDALVQSFEGLRAMVKEFNEGQTIHTEVKWELPMKPPTYDKTTESIVFEERAIVVQRAFSMIAKLSGTPYYIKDAQQLSKRLTDSKKTLARSGWDITIVGKTAGVNRYGFRFTKPEFVRNEVG